MEASTHQTLQSNSSYDPNNGSFAQTPPHHLYNAPNNAQFQHNMPAYLPIQSGQPTQQAFNTYLYQTMNTGQTDYFQQQHLQPTPQPIQSTSQPTSQPASQLLQSQPSQYTSYENETPLRRSPRKNAATPDMADANGVSKLCHVVRRILHHCSK